VSLYQLSAVAAGDGAFKMFGECVVGQNAISNSRKLGHTSGLAGAGNVVPLAVAAASRMPSLPNLPPVAETLPGFESVGWQALLAPGRNAGCGDKEGECRRRQSHAR
jgi:hypothetical protein